MDLVTAEDVAAAARVLDGVVDVTPLQGSRALADHVGHPVLLKCEHLQRTGSFKLRGAYHRIHALDDAQRARGVVCASAGNHAQGVALGATMQGVEATVFMPEQAPLPKVQATRGYGARVVTEAASFAEALVQAQQFAADNDQVFVHPFDHPDVIAGQGTLGRELLAQSADFATVVVPIGGGGLVSGTAVAIRAARPDVRVIGVQAAGCASVAASVAAGHPVAVEHVDTIADGIAVKQPGELTLAHIRALVDDVVVVDDATIARAVTLLLERAKQVCEPSGAVGVAALLDGAIDLDGPVAVVLSGGNIDPLMLDHLVRVGLAGEGRHLTIHTRIDDRPGALATFLEVLASLRANVVGVEHQRFGRRLRLGQVDVVVELEVRGDDHTGEILAELRQQGHVVTPR